MKLQTINAIAGILSGMKINKINDKAVKTALVNDYLHLRKFVKDADEERKELVEKFQKDWADELGAVEAYRRENKPVEGHDAYLEAERDANKTIAEIFDREVETMVKAVPTEAFLAACDKEELTLEQIALLQEAGVIEA